MDIYSLVLDNEDYLIDVRRYLHMYPEVSPHEDETVKYLCNKLRESGIKYVEIKECGILATVDGKLPGRTCLLRGDIDALSIDETEDNLCTKRVCRSQIPGVMHACGHDGNAAVLLTTLKILSENANQMKGSVVGMFERGEEKLATCWEPMLEYLKEQNCRIDTACAVHMKYDIPTGMLAFVESEN